MNKVLSIKEHVTISPKLNNGRAHLRYGNSRKKQSAWFSRKDVSSNSYVVKTTSVSDWYTDVRTSALFVKYDKPTLTQIQVASKTYALFNELSAIAEQINDASELLTYQTDWDEEGSLATNEIVFNNAINFLVSYSNFIYQNYSNSILSAPYIDITREGGISILWETSKAKFFIIFKATDSKTAFFFGEKTDAKIPFKSAIEIDGPVEESIASWMKTNLI